MGIENTCQFVGNLGSDPKLSSMQSGNARAAFNVAVNEKYKDQETTTWVHCIAWGRLAEVCGQYLAKGKLVAVRGRYRVNEWTDKDSGEKKSRPEFHLDSMKMFGGGQGHGDQRPAPQNQGGGYGGGQGYGAPPASDDDIPF